MRPPDSTAASVESPSPMDPSSGASGNTNTPAVPHRSTDASQPPKRKRAKLEYNKEIKLAGFLPYAGA